MYSSLRRFRTYCLRWIPLFFCALVLALGMGYFPQHFWGGTSAIAQQPNPSQLLQIGVEAYQQGDYSAAIAAWDSALTTYSPHELVERALVNENLARAHQQRGETAIALDHWEAAATAYQATDNATQFGRMLTEQAQAYNSLGQHQRSLSLLCGAEPVMTTSDNTVSVLCEGGAYAVAQETADFAGQAAAIGSLAEAERLSGKYDEAQHLLESGLSLVQAHSIKQYEAPMRNSLGTVYNRQAQIALNRAESAKSIGLNANESELRADASTYTETALGHFREAIDAANQQGDLAAELLAQSNLLQLEQQQAENRSITPIRQRLSQLIADLPPSRETAYAAMTLAKSYQAAEKNFSCEAYQENPLQQSWLEEGRRLAQSIGDARAESFALGELGHIEECRSNLEEAAYLSDLAQIAASDALESADSAYLWEWQTGRLYRKQGNLAQAQKAYRQAIATLETVRTDILSADRELQFDFRDKVDPVYRQYIELQLETTRETTREITRETASASDAPNQLINLPNAQVQETLQTINALRLAELQNFFGNDCVLTPSTDAQTRLLEGDPHTTVISSVVLPDKVLLIANFPNGATETLQIREVEALEKTVETFRTGLKQYRNLVYDRTSAETLYQQLIRPFEAALADADTQTLVFVQDGFLRNIPMAALHDGKQYLIQRYAIATTPTLSLTAAQAPTRPVPRALAVGLSQETVTESGRVFLALSSVLTELVSVTEQLPGSRVLLDQEFTPEKLTSAWEETPYSILHIATHGQFSLIPEETFIITGTDNAGIAGELTFGKLASLIQRASPDQLIDLITLTACETATGDDRTTLGLAGVAIRSGARSAIASLWKLDDATAAQLIRHLYGTLQQTQFSKAKALQQAQIAVIEDDPTANPGSWAPLILVGNWQ
jgi:CHAT domain-containing protein